MLMRGFIKVLFVKGEEQVFYFSFIIEILARVRVQTEIGKRSAESSGEIAVDRFARACPRHPRIRADFSSRPQVRHSTQHAFHPYYSTRKLAID